ncbi:putative sodium-coupled neutral amino acid transporter 11 isoform X2 [Mustela lutreola]|uniref:putative sodium-coupled neutral amino acid transporter 11 isoform X2 n=1 Tax=Mustela lutreola TaxID=9666 RepID=UPI0027976BAC|nr:putative sodium-coupled neutral amino acid transporter 11 isoform X2 [Mustela lutreola]
MGYQAQGPVIPPQSNLDDRETLVSEQKHKGKTYHQFTAVFNVVNSIIGSGIIGLPYSMKQAGFPLGILLLFGVSYVTDFSLILLIKGGALSGTDTYQSLVNKTFGFPGYILLSVLQFFYPFIAMISYNIITGDTLSKVFQRIPGVDPENLLIGRHFIIVLSTAAFALPLSLYRDIAKLGKISFLSTVLTTLILGIVMARVVSLGPYIPKTEDAWVFAKPSAIQALGVMSFGDLFENYCRNDDLVTFGRFCYAVTVILTYPIECFVTREGVLCAAPLIFIIPSACYLKLSEEPRTHSDKIMSCVMLPVGVMVMVTGLLMAVTNPQDCTHGQEMFYCFPDNLSLTNISVSHLQLTTQLSVLNSSIFQ